MLQFFSLMDPGIRVVECSPPYLRMTLIWCPSVSAGESRHMSPSAASSSCGAASEADTDTDFSRSMICNTLVEVAQRGYKTVSRIACPLQGR